MKTLGDRIVARCRTVDSAVCIGLDPRLDLIPRALDDEAASVLSATAKDPRFDAARVSVFCRHVIDLVAPHVAAVKPQVAWFERLLAPGFAAFTELCRYAREAGMIVIADVKRGDIGTTASAYAAAYLGRDGLEPLADAVTVHPYLGSDGIRPFLDAGRRTGLGAFVLVRTSNPSAVELQDLDTPEGPVYERVADLVHSLNEPLGESGYGPLGAVVGATWPEHLRRLRSRLSGSILLLPGYGAQGAGAEDVAGGFDAEGQGALVSASRSLTFPWAGEGAGAPHDWQDRILAAVMEMNADLARVRGR